MRKENEERQRKAEEDVKTTTTTTTTPTTTKSGVKSTPRAKTVRDRKMERELARLKKKNEELEKERAKEIEQLERVRIEKENAQKVIDDLEKEKDR